MCVVCEGELPRGKRRFCSDRCGQRAAYRKKIGAPISDEGFYEWRPIRHEDDHLLGKTTPPKKKKPSNLMTRLAALEKRVVELEKLTAGRNVAQKNTSSKHIRATKDLLQLETFPRSGTGQCNEKE